MTAPRFLVPPGALDGAGTALVLDGEEGRHATQVRRIRQGERVDVADGQGAVACCEVGAVARGRLELTVLSTSVEPRPVPRLVLAQALAKGGRDEQAVEAATELGVDAVVPWQARRSVVVWSGERGERARQRWASTARAAAKQSRRAWVPQVREPVDTEGLAALVASASTALVLHEDARAPLAAAPLAGQGEVLVVVGPEGGVEEREMELLVAAGARAVLLGPQVLRSSTAGPAALAVLSVRLGRW